MADTEHYVRDDVRGFLDMLKAMGEVTFETSTPWTEGKQSFTGVPLDAKVFNEEPFGPVAAIRGFTTLSETRSPEQVVDLLNRYFTRQVEVIYRHGGTLDKFIGDAVMAFWNAPTESPDHARRAVHAALDMLVALDDFKRELAERGEGLGEFDIGIGLHTGPAVVGFLGSDSRMEYTAIGDTVNLGSRIEGTTKGVARVLVSGATKSACGANSRFKFIHRGQFKVKGREEPVELYEPVRNTDPSRAGGMP